MKESIRRFVLESCRSSGLAEPDPRAPIRWIVINSGVLPNSKLICPCWIGDEPLPSVVVKFARDDVYNGRVQAEHEALKQLQVYAGMGARFVPRPLGITKISKHTVTLETAIPGRPLRTYLQEHPLHNRDVLERWRLLARWLTDLAVKSARPVGEGDFQKLVLGPFEAALNELRLHESERIVLRGLVATAQGLVRPGGFPVVYTHNDLGTPNVMANKRGQFQGIIDWESAAPGLPGMDLIYFLDRFAYEAMGAGTSDPLRGFRQIFFKAAPASSKSLLSSLAREWLHTYCRQVGMDTNWLSVVFALCWIGHARNEQEQVKARSLSPALRIARPSAMDTHFLDHLRYYLRNVSRFISTMGLEPKHSQEYP